jgi:hypothetical protein
VSVNMRPSGRFVFLPALEPVIEPV